MANNIKINANEIQNAIEILKANGIAFELKTPKITDKFEYDENNLAICKFSQRHFDLNEFDEETQLRAKKLGIHPDYIDILNQANEIKNVVKANIRTVKVRPEGAIAPGKFIRNLVQDAFNNENLTDEILDKLSDKEFSKKMKLAYSLLLEITDKSNEEIKILRKDAKNHVRYSPQVYSFNKRSFLITNDLYDKNVTPVENIFNEFNLINE